MFRTKQKKGNDKKSSYNFIAHRTLLLHEYDRNHKHKIYYKTFTFHEGKQTNRRVAVIAKQSEVFCGANEHKGTYEKKNPRKIIYCNN